MLQRSLVAGAVSLCAAAVLVACGGGGDPIKVAASNLTVNVAATNVAAVAAKPFTFPAGVPAFGTTGATTLTFSAPAAGATSNSFTLTSGTGTATGTTKYGSCIFEVSLSTVTGISAGQTITVNPCSIQLDLLGTEAGTSIRVGSRITLGTASSSTLPDTVINISETGQVTLGGTNLGVVALTLLTGS